MMPLRPADRVVSGRAGHRDPTERLSPDIESQSAEGAYGVVAVDVGPVPFVLPPLLHA
jgi:hypothetical protein